MNELEHWAALEAGLGLVQEDEEGPQIVSLENFELEEGLVELEKPRIANLENEELQEGLVGEEEPWIVYLKNGELDVGLIEEKEPRTVNLKNGELEEGLIEEEEEEEELHIENVGNEEGLVEEEVLHIENFENEEGLVQEEELEIGNFENGVVEAELVEEEPQIANLENEELEAGFLGEEEEDEPQIVNLKNVVLEAGLVEEEEPRILNLKNGYVKEALAEGELKIENFENCEVETELIEEEKPRTVNLENEELEAGLVEEEPQIAISKNGVLGQGLEEEESRNVNLISAELEEGLVEEELQIKIFENGEVEVGLVEEEPRIATLKNAEFEEGLGEEEEPRIVVLKNGELKEGSVEEKEPRIVTMEIGDLEVGLVGKEEPWMVDLKNAELVEGLVEEEKPQSVTLENGELEAGSVEEEPQILNFEYVAFEVGLVKEEAGFLEEEIPQIVNLENGELEAGLADEKEPHIVNLGNVELEGGLVEVEEPQIINFENGELVAGLLKEEESLVVNLENGKLEAGLTEEEPQIGNSKNGEGKAKKEQDEVPQGKGGEVPHPVSMPSPPSEGVMQKFRLYETLSNYYMIGRDKTREYWRVLKIDRTEPSELNICEDSATYTERECSDLLRRIHEGNRSTGGLKFVTTCYGIVGFIKFRGPYYMLLISKRRKIGAICGHTVYAVAKSEMIPIPNSFVRPSKIDIRSENRYKKLMCMVDLTKDFFFSYSYHVMRSLQKNMCNRESGQVLYETMFVWNEFLTRGIRTILKNTLWTVALVYGFFKQATLSISGRELKMTLIARRSRHYAGTRYLKRGVNEKGRVANDVETEQIVFENDAEGLPQQVSSVVQNRGSIPLFWSQETSRLIIKPDIILSRRDQTYQATRLHFENLVKRYGNPIIILNLIKTRERRPRESTLRTEFANAIEHINKDLSEETRLRFLHWDLHKHSRSQPSNVLLLLGKVATYALELTGLFYCNVTPSLRPKGFSGFPHFKESSSSANCHNGDGEQDAYIKDDSNLFLSKLFECNGSANSPPAAERPTFQNGVLRTNCIDCLDRTNVAQYAYGIVALGQQLHALGVIDTLKIDLDDPLADELMRFYERMGDTLAHQYGGSAAHNKIFSQRRGQWKATMQSQELFRTLQRYYSNAYMDEEKQNSINVFLGYFQPEADKPDVWEMDCDQYYNMEQNGQSEIYENDWSIFKRSFSDGNIIRKRQSSRPVSETEKDLSTPVLSGQHSSEFTPETSTAENEVSSSSYVPSITPVGDFMEEIGRDKCFEHENKDTLDSSNFVDLDWLSSSGTCEEDISERSMLMNSSNPGLSTDNVVHEVGEASSSMNEHRLGIKGIEQVPTRLTYDDECKSQVVEDFPDSFVRWVNCGGAMSWNF